jgi:predicted NUDIX family NTP pyrophosphohydrolase
MGLPQVDRMPSKVSAGLLMFRATKKGLEVLLVHPGGPYFQRKDEGAWTIPKGEIGEGEDLLSRAKLEFEEEDRTWKRETKRRQGRARVGS